MVGNVLQNFVARPWSFASGSGVASAGVGIGRGAGVSGMGVGGLSSPPVHGVVGGLEGLSLLCESPRVTRKNSGGGGGGGGGLMWSAEGGRQLETWRVGFLFFVLVYDASSGSSREELSSVVEIPFDEC